MRAFACLAGAVVAAIVGLAAMLAAGWIAGMGSHGLGGDAEAYAVAQRRGDLIIGATIVATVIAVVAFLFAAWRARRDPALARRSAFVGGGLTLLLALLAAPVLLRFFF